MVVPAFRIKSLAYVTSLLRFGPCTHGKEADVLLPARELRATPVEGVIDDILRDQAVRGTAVQLRSKALGALSCIHVCLEPKLEPTRYCSDSGKLREVINRRL